MQWLCIYKFSVEKQQTVSNEVRNQKWKKEPHNVKAFKFGNKVQTDELHISNNLSL